MKTFNVDWLGSCPRCGNNKLIVNTETGNSKFLYEDDTLHCKECKLTGKVEVTDDYQEDRVGYAVFNGYEEADAEGCKFRNGGWWCTHACSLVR